MGCCLALWLADRPVNDVEYSRGRSIVATVSLVALMTLFFVPHEFQMITTVVAVVLTASLIVWAPWPSIDHVSHRSTNGLVWTHFLFALSLALAGDNGDSLVGWHHRRLEPRRRRIDDRMCGFVLLFD